MGGSALSPRELMRLRSLERRKGLRVAQRLWRSLQISHHLHDFLAPHRASGLLRGMSGYVAIRGEYEIAPLPFLRYYLPCVFSRDEMVFVATAPRYSGGVWWRRDVAGILYPASSSTAQPQDALLSDMSHHAQLWQQGAVGPGLWVMMIPCLAVHLSSGMRLGYGGGYYDRYLACAQKKERGGGAALYKIAVAGDEDLYGGGEFSQKQEQALRPGPYDIAVQGIISPSGFRALIEVEDFLA